jgi:hypothetical protein
MRIHPLSTEPFTPPTDRDMAPSERRTFVRTHRTCVFGTARRADGPALSVVSCVLDERWPFTYLQVYCDAAVDDEPELVVDVMMAVAARMSGEALPAEVRPMIRAMADAEDRVVLRCRPYETFAQPPRHLHRNDQAERVTHWVSATLPWDAADDHEGARA